MKKSFSFKSIKSKMLFGFSLVLVLVIGLGIFNYLVVNESNKDTKEIVDEQLVLLIADEKIAYYTADQLASVRGYILYGNSELKGFFDGYTETRKHYQDVILEMNDTEETRYLSDTLDEWTAIITDEVFVAYESGNEEEAKQILQEKVQPLSGEILLGYQAMAEERETLINEIGEDSIAQGEVTLIVSVIMPIVIVVLTVIAALITSRVITKPIGIVMERMQRIAEGNLSEEPLEVTSQDETGQLVTATNNMNHNMRDLLNQINNVSETVTSQSEELTQSSNEVMTGTMQVASTMQELASGSESQANNAADLSSGMDSFTARVLEANKNSERVQESSNEILKMTNEGTELMESSTEQMATIDRIVHDAVEKVEGLDTHSQEISELVSVIQDIADQTNLLALNAAIEAARAGEHGQGFAVVADEVRKLAEQSSDSVTDITEIVNRIQNESSVVAASLQDGYKDVEQGTEQIITTGETFKNISTAITDMANRINHVSENLTGITASGQEMNTSIQEIAAISEESAAGVEQTSASTQQTNAAMQEVAASSDDLAKLAEDLNGLVNRFII